VFLAAVVGVIALSVSTPSLAGGQAAPAKTPFKGTPEELFNSVRQNAEQGDANLQFTVGVMYANGMGTPEDYGQAVLWYRKAAEQGYAPAQFHLGGAYVMGRGVPQDYAEAHKWMSLAAARATGKVDPKPMAKARNSLAKKMTPAQLAEAQKRASEWLAAFEEPKK
jgi:TPR repeat protein